MVFLLCFLSMLTISSKPVLLPPSYIILFGICLQNSLSKTLAISVILWASRCYGAMMVDCTEFVLYTMNMAVTKPCRSPMPTTCRLSATDGVTYSDPYMYRHVGSLQYLSFTRPDLSFSVHKVSKFMHNPLDTHWQAVERILWYLKHTISTGLYLQPSSSCNLQAFFDSDWATYHDDQ